jgi:hypothetical protein
MVIPVIDRWYLLYCFSSIALAGVTAYSFWVKIRVIRLKADYIEIMLDFRDQARKIGATEEVAYQRFMYLMRYCVRTHAERLSFATTLYIHLKCEANGIQPEQQPFPIDNPKLRDAIDVASHRLGRRSIDYMAYETLTGRMLLPILKSLPRFSKDEEERIVTMWGTPHAVASASEA